jgi:hypothetical protein
MVVPLGVGFHGSHFVLWVWCLLGFVYNDTQQDVNGKIKLDLQAVSCKDGKWKHMIQE